MAEEADLGPVSDLLAARAIADQDERIPIGLLYQNTAAPRYEDFTTAGLGMSTNDKVDALNRELDRFAIH